MRAPAFWSRPPGLEAALLAPFGHLWGRVTAARALRPGTRVGVPVICVGNLTAGGTGKTPAVLALARRLAARGVRVAIVSRGHGGRARGPVRVDPARHGAGEVGDEPLLLADAAPTYVARDRLAGCRQAVAEGAGAILLDDGFQNPAVAKDLAIVVIDAAAGFGNGRCIPAGPLREPVAGGLARAGIVLLVGPPADRAAFRAGEARLAGRPVVEAEIRPVDTGTDWQGRRVLAFAGIGRPEKFFATLRALGADLVAAHGFPDHAPYPRAMLERLSRDAAAARAMLVTTDKDAVRLPAWFRGRAVPLPVTLEPASAADGARLDAALLAATGPATPA